jgi:Beta-galactosidase
VSRPGIWRVGFLLLIGLIALAPGLMAPSAKAADGESLRFGVADPFAMDAPEKIQRRLTLYKQAGIGILRTDTRWPGGNDLPDGALPDLPLPPLYALAQQDGFRFKSGIGLFYGPSPAFFSQHPDAQMTNQEGLKSVNVISYWYPDLRRYLEDGDDRIFAYLAKRDFLPSLDYVVVPLGPAAEPLYPVPWTTTEPNKPMRFWFYDANAQADFPAKMKAKYGTVDAANQEWGTNYPDWNSVTIPTPGVQAGPMWRDVLEWYRDAKRDFIVWQVAHYRRLIEKYYPQGDAPHLLILMPGAHITPHLWEQAIRTGDGDDRVKMMADSEFLIDLAHKVGAYLQYTGLPNTTEIQYAEKYMRERGFEVPLWGENAGNKGEPRELDEEVLSNGLYGQEYIGSNLFEADHVTPTAKFLSLGEAHRWFAGARASRAAADMVFDVLPIVQGGCLYADPRKAVSLCMQADANLILRRNGRLLWSSETSHLERGFCSLNQDPASACTATFQGDGNFVVSRGKQPLWDSKTPGRGKHLAILDHPPYLEILGADGEVVWAATQR